MAAMRPQNPMPKTMQKIQKVVLISVTASAQNIRPERLASSWIKSALLIVDPRVSSRAPTEKLSLDSLAYDL